MRAARMKVAPQLQGLVRNHEFDGAGKWHKTPVRPAFDQSVGRLISCLLLCVVHSCVIPRVDDADNRVARPVPAARCAASAFTRSHQTSPSVLPMGNAWLTFPIHTHAVQQAQCTAPMHQSGTWERLRLALGTRWASPVSREALTAPKPVLTLLTGGRCFDPETALDEICDVH
eukprot:SAG11_NODE_979_length_6319_cov_2.950322_4_plen_173_part_00